MLLLFVWLSSNQSSVSKINRRIVKLMFESIWTEHTKSIYNCISKVFTTTIKERPSLRLSVCPFWLCKRRCVYFFANPDRPYRPSLTQVTNRPSLEGSSVNACKNIRTNIPRREAPRRTVTENKHSDAAPP